MRAQTQLIEDLLDVSRFRDIDKDDTAAQVSEVKFPVPVPENAAFTIDMPRELKDEAGRTLENAAMFPLKVATGIVNVMKDLPLATKKGGTLYVFSLP